MEMGLGVVSVGVGVWSGAWLPGREDVGQRGFLLTRFLSSVVGVLPEVWVVEREEVAVRGVLLTMLVVAPSCVLALGLHSSGECGGVMACFFNLVSGPEEAEQ